MTRDEPRHQQAAARQRAFSRALAQTMALVGVLTVVIVVAALILGAWLSKRFGLGALGTIAALIASIPAVTVAVFVIVRRTASGLESRLAVSDQSPEA